MRGRNGFVVFGLLLAIVGTITAAVLIGVFLERAQRGPPPPSVPRELRHAARPLEVRFGALTAARVPQGRPLWVGQAVEGRVVVFENERSNRIIGYVSESDLLEGSREAHPATIRK